MKKLRRLGLTFSLDDVSDCSISLNKLMQLPIKQIKIDSVLVKNLVKNQAVIQTLLSMSQHLGILAIAEGVETFAQQKKLAQLGCQYYQGHYLCAALSAKDLLSWLKKLTKT
jgi:EAL domain-containing protein (putative c-di-GMP-specific phosphodiesterase class I)